MNQRIARGTDPLLLADRGQVYELLGNTEDAKKDYESAREKGNRDEWIRERLRKFKEAEQFYKRALEVDPEYGLAHFNVGNLYDEIGKVSEARRHYERALELNPHYADAHFNLALLCERHGDALRAVRHWKAYLKIDSTTEWAEIARRQLTQLREAAIVRTPG